MFKVDINAPEIVAVLDGLIRAGLRPTPALREIGEILVQSSKERFATSTGPDGEKWAPNQDSTLEAYLSKFKGTRKPSGGLSQRGEKVAGSKKPLIGETKSLSTQIYWELAGENKVAIGSPLEYAAMQQFGGTKAEFPHLWGDIPPRPFLGLSADDADDVLEVLVNYFRAAAV